MSYSYRCPYLEWKSGSMGPFLSVSDRYYCTLTNTELGGNDSVTVKHKCDCEEHCAYENCPVYRDR